MPRVTDPQTQIDSLTTDFDRLYAENQRLKMLLHNAKVGANKWCLKYNEAKWTRIRAVNSQQEKQKIIDTQRRIILTLLTKVASWQE